MMQSNFVQRLLSLPMDMKPRSIMSSSSSSCCEHLFSSSERLSVLTEASNSSVDSGTFDVYDDPEDHFYDEPLLPCESENENDCGKKNGKLVSLIKSSSSSSVEIGSSFDDNSLCSLNNSWSEKQLLLPPRESLNHQLNLIKFDGKFANNHHKLSSSSDLVVNLPPPKCSSGVVKSFLPPLPPHISSSPPPLPAKPLPKSKAILKPPQRPPRGPTLGLPPPPLPAPRLVDRSKSSNMVDSSECKENRASRLMKKTTSLRELILGPDNYLVTKESKNHASSTATTPSSSSSPSSESTKSRHSHGSIYETAFDVRVNILSNNSHQTPLQMDNVKRDHILKQNHHIPNAMHANQTGFIGHRIGSESSASFNMDTSSRSSTASSTCSSTDREISNIINSNLNSHSSATSNAVNNRREHRSQDQLIGSANNSVKCMHPRRLGIKTNLHIPRSKSSDVTLNLSSATPKIENGNGENLRRFAECKRNRTKMGSLSTRSMLKSATSDALSSLAQEPTSNSPPQPAPRYLLRAKSITDNSCRTPMTEHNPAMQFDVVRFNSSKNSSQSFSDSFRQVQPNSGVSSFTASKVPSCSSSSTSTSATSSSQSTSKRHTNGEHKQPPPLPPQPNPRSFRPLELKLSELKSSNSGNLTSPQIQSPLTDTRPLDDYDTPWDSNKRLNKVFKQLINTPTGDKLPDSTVNTVNIVQPTSNEFNPIASKACPTGNTCKDMKSAKESSCTASDGDDNNNLNQKISRPSSLPTSDPACIDRKQQPPSDADSKLDRSRKLSLPSTESKNTKEKSISAPRLSLTLDLGTSGAKTQVRPTCTKPSLIFTGQPIASSPEAIDVNLPLLKQGWYHGAITRLDAENVLRNLQEGSFLIRNCESTKQDFSLSLKSAKGFMHMKIVRQSDGKFVLGVFSKPFQSIPEMLKHYSVNKLPIRGAEHMSLLYPVIDQLL